MIVCKKKLAVCILTHNRLNLLKKTINSVLNSKSNDFEIFVFNDNSTDGTNEYLESMEKQGFLKEFRQNKNIGLYRNANSIVENIKAKYCLMLNDDDTIEPTYFIETVRVANLEDSISMVGTAWNKINENGKILESIIYKELNKPSILIDKEFFLHNLNGLNFPWGGTLIRMDKIGDLRFNYKYYGTGADSIFLCNLALGNKVGYIPEPLFNYRIHRYQMSQIEDIGESFKKWKRIWGFYEDLILKNFDDNKIFLKKHNIAVNKTISYLLQECPDLKIFFKILFSKYFNFLLMNFQQLKGVVSRFLKLIMGK